MADNQSSRRGGRPNVFQEELSAVLDGADAWNHVEPVFCGRVGPDEEVCVDVTGHPSFHHAAGVGGLSWGDGDK